MNVKKSAATAGAVALLLTGGLLVTAPAASADSCGPGQAAKVSQQKVKNPLTGEMEWGTVTTCPDVEVSSSTSISAVTPAVGVDFRDDNGNRTSSGLSPRDQFKYLNAKKMGNSRDGMLIKVMQITKNQGGWGPLYIGWIPVKYTQIPSMF